MLLTGRMDGKTKPITDTTAFCATIQSAYGKAGRVGMQINLTQQGMVHRGGTAKSEQLSLIAALHFELVTGAHGLKLIPERIVSKAVALGGRKFFSPCVSVYRIALPDVNLGGKDVARSTAEPLIDR